ncbi:MAG: hypothetical protein ABI622_09480, partial [Chloroflexota bacterium]
MTSSRGGDRRVATLVDALVPHLPPLGVLRVPANARAAHLAARRSALPPSTPMVVVARTDDEAHRLADDLEAWVGADHVRTLAERAALPLERALPEHDESAERLETLAMLAGHRQGQVIVAPLLALVQRTLGVEQLRDARMTVRAGERIDQRRLLTALVQGGYEASVEVSGVGEFANRGGIVDVWPPGAVEPVRIDLFGDEVESIRSFDPMTQGSRRRLTEVLLLPASEFLPPGGWESLSAAITDRTEALSADLARLEQGDVAEAAETWAALLTGGPAADHVPPNAHVVLTDPDELAALARDLDAQASERRDGLVASGELTPGWPLPYDASGTLAALHDRAVEQLDEQVGDEAGYRAAPTLPGRADHIGEWLAAEVGRDRATVVTTDQASRIAELLEAAERSVAPAAELRAAPPRGAIGLVHGSLTGGFLHEPSGLLLLTDRELFGATRIRRLAPSKRVVTRDLIGKLSPGDLVVHVDHGIARYV